MSHQDESSASELRFPNLPKMDPSQNRPKKELSDVLTQYKSALTEKLDTGGIPSDFLYGLNSGSPQSAAAFLDQVQVSKNKK